MAKAACWILIDTRRERWGKTDDDTLCPRRKHGIRWADLPCLLNTISIPLWRRPQVLFSERRGRAVRGDTEATRRTLSGSMILIITPEALFGTREDRWCNKRRQLGSRDKERLSRIERNPDVIDTRSLGWDSMLTNEEGGGHAQSSCPYDLGYTRTTMAVIQRKQNREVEQILKAVPVQIAGCNRLHESVLVIADQHAAVNTFSRPCTHRPSHHESVNTRSP